jgi:NAD(P)-dependent dehydrogenase (short-subunit alcohol dehydrogenase family)
MSPQIDGSTAIVTGAASGMGEAAAKRLAADGAQVAVVDIDDDGGEATVEAIESEGGTAHCIEADLTDSAQVERMVEETVEEYGGLDIAFNHAGIGGDMAATEEQTEDNWDSVIDTNLKSVWLCLMAEIPEMKKNGGGAIVNTSSIAGFTAAGTAPYVASKHGVLGLTRVAAAEHAENDIRVNAVCPGVIDTPMAQSVKEQSPDELDHLVQMQPQNRLGKPEEVAAAVRWLVSEDASFVTGNPYPVDGGFLSL